MWRGCDKDDEQRDDLSPKLVYTDLQDDQSHIASVDINSVVVGLRGNKDLKFEFPDPLTCLCCLYFEVDLSKLLLGDKTFQDLKNRVTTMSKRKEFVGDRHIASEENSNHKLGFFNDNYEKPSNSIPSKYISKGARKAKSQDPSRLHTIQSSLPKVLNLKGASLLRNKVVQAEQHSKNPQGFSSISKDEVIELKNFQSSSNPTWPPLETQLSYLKGRLERGRDQRSSSTNDASYRSPTTPAIRYHYKPELKSKESYERIITEQSYDIRKETPFTDNTFTSTPKKVRFKDELNDTGEFEHSLPLIRSNGIPLALQKPLVTELTRDIAKRKSTGFFMKRSANDGSLTTKYRTFL